MKQAVQIMVVLTVLALVVVMAGCGGDGGAQMDTAKKPEPPSPPPPPTVLGSGSGTVFYYQNSTQDVRAAEWDGSNERVVLAPGTCTGQFDVACYGGQRFVIYTGYVGSTRTLLACRDDGTGAVDILQGSAAWPTVLEISPSGTRIAYIDVVTGGVDGGLYTADLVFSGGGPPVGIANAQLQVPWAGTYTVGGATWSPDERYLAFRCQLVASQPNYLYVHEVGATWPGWDPAPAPIIGPDERQLMFDEQPQWSPVLPDGSSRIAFTVMYEKNGRYTGGEVRTQLMAGPVPVGASEPAITETNTGLDWNTEGTWMEGFTDEGGRQVQLAFFGSSRQYEGLLRSVHDGSSEAEEVLEGVDTNQKSEVRWAPSSE